MKELKVGERITIECVEASSHKCTDCIFYKDQWADCPTTIFQCGRDTEFKQVQVHTFTDEELEKLKETYHTAGYDLGVEKTLDVFCKNYCVHHNCNNPNQPECEIRNEFYKELRKEETK